MKIKLSKAELFKHELKKLLEKYNAEISLNFSDSHEELYFHSIEYNVEIENDFFSINENDFFINKNNIKI